MAKAGQVVLQYAGAFAIALLIVLQAFATYMVWAVVAGAIYKFVGVSPAESGGIAAALMTWLFMRRSKKASSK